jgi:ABC-type nitrate/sulfonate/bicarbonate transport system substrate-binding protein
MIFEDSPNFRKSVDAAARPGFGPGKGEDIVAERTLNVIVFPGGFNLPLWAGIRQGFFARRGLSLALHFTTSSMEQLAGLVRGDWDLGLTGFDNVVA